LFFVVVVLKKENWKQGKVKGAKSPRRKNWEIEGEIEEEQSKETRQSIPVHLLDWSKLS